MNLYLLRHGLAVEPGTPGFAHDADRPLTRKGERKLRSIAAAMRAMELNFDHILSSPYVRARRTAEIVAQILGQSRKLKFSQALTPGANARQLVQELHDLAPPPEEILLVGHEPYLSQLVSLLVSGDSDCLIALKKGGLCKLSVTNSLRAGRCGEVQWLLTPKQMALMG